MPESWALVLRFMDPGPMDIATPFYQSAASKFLFTKGQASIPNFQNYHYLFIPTSYTSTPIRISQLCYQNIFNKCMTFYYLTISDILAFLKADEYIQKCC